MALLVAVVVGLLAACSGSGSSHPSSAGSASPAASSLAGLPVAHPTVWVCRPGMAANPCEGGLDATVVPASGPTHVEPFTPAAQPKIDCFYVYPTVSQAQTINAPLAAEPAVVGIARAQAARFASACRVFVPVYRQLTLYALTQALTGKGFGDAQQRALADQDVDSAWHDYLAHDNHGRGVVLIGHSQGAMQVIRLVRDEVEKNADERRLLVSVVALGGNLLVPQGRDVGGSFSSVPLCRVTSQTGCAVAFSSFSSPPPSNALFGRAPLAGTQPPGAPGPLKVACVNPADPSGGRQELHPYLPTRQLANAALPVTKREDLPNYPTGFVTYPGLLHAQCRSENDATWLQIDSDGAPGPTRPPLQQTLGSQWGLHLYDVNATLGDLTALVARQAAAWS